MSFLNQKSIRNPLTNSLFVDDFDFLSAPTPPGSEEMETEDDILMITEDGEIMVTEG